MKNLIVFFIGVVFLFVINAKGQNENIIKTKIPVEAVVLYLGGAEISHSKEISCNAGRNLLIIEDITPKMDGKSIRISVNGGIQVLSIESKLGDANEGIATGLLKSLKDSITHLEEYVQKCNDEIDALETEKKMLITNMAIGGQTNGVAMAELEKASIFYRNRIGEINSKISNNKSLLNKYNHEFMELKANLLKRENLLKKEINTIYILLSSPAQQNAKVNVKYLVNDAGWNPTYDLVADDIEKPIKLIYRAKIFNGTKINWTKINLKLSTADPFSSALQPELSPWYLNFQYGNRINTLNKGNYNQAVVDEKNIKQVGDVVYQEIDVIDFNAEFELKGTFDLPSDGKPYLADVLENQLAASFQYISVPKMDKNAFLISKVTGWEDLNLVEGPVNIYFGNAFVGQSYLSTSNVSDTLEISLGRDKNIMITRNKIKNFSSSTLMGNKKKETFSYELIVRNNKKTAANIVLYDQIPVSQNSEIEVETIEISKANIETATGKLWWNMQLNPGETKKVIITYAIRYPKTSAVNLQQSRKMYKMKF